MSEVTKSWWDTTWALEVQKSHYGVFRPGNPDECSSCPRRTLWPCDLYLIAQDVENALIQLAQRDAELEALREKVAGRYCAHRGNLDDWCEANIESTHGACCKRCTHNRSRPEFPFADLSDNQEGDAYEGEGCEDCGDDYGRDGLVWRATDDLWAMLGWEERGLLCPNCFVKRLRAKGTTPYFAAVHERTWLDLMQPVNQEGR